MRGERFMLDTNMFVYMALDYDAIDRDVKAIIEDPNATFCMSVESIKELIVAYRNKGLGSKRWKTPEEMVRAIRNEFYIDVLPLTFDDVATYSSMTINEPQGHKDPSDHIIIAQAIHLHLPLISSDSRFEFYRSQGLDLIYNRK